MKRTISAEVGKGSVNHNSRKFKAENVDGSRTHLNIDYCNERIQTVYHQLFDEALKRYNEKQTRADRRIPNYYEKIRSGNQEKPFHEIILQIGNKEDMSATGEYAELARTVLDEYYRGFQERNPNLRVFSAHLHMDEATPHIHIDFVPFTTGSKRGLDTRVSLKQALAVQGFKGGTRGATEWAQWVQSEKEQLAAVMERYDIQWEQKGTGNKFIMRGAWLRSKEMEEIIMTLSMKEKKILYAYGCLSHHNTVTRLKWLTALTVDPEAKRRMLGLARKVETEMNESWYEDFYHHLRMEMDEYRRLKRNLRVLKSYTDYEEDLYEEAV